MAYVKTNWVNDSTKLNATNMNHIEDGISANDILLASVVSSIANITSGVTEVGLATKANQDGSGNVITSTYARSDALATVATTGSYTDLLNLPTIVEVTETTVSNWGFTKNLGTITGVSFNGSTVSSGTVALGNLQAVIDSSNKLNADLIDDTSTTNKFVTAADKTTWNGKSVVTVSDSGTATDEVSYITIDGVEKKLAGGSGGMSNPMTAMGDLIEGSLTGNPVRLPKGSANQLLSSTVSALEWTNTLPIITTAPSAANNNGGIIICVLSSEPATKYNGYLYLITGS